MLTIEEPVAGQSVPWKYNRLRSAPVLNAWADSPTAEAKIHRIHPYPARFPGFIVHKALDYAAQEGVNVKRVADVFCGSGTVAFEVATRNIEFWGCDINPVATLIARVKSFRLDPDAFADHTARILHRFRSASDTLSISIVASERLRPWFEEQQFLDLARLRNAIVAEVGGMDEEAAAFECAFSAILKSVSRWRPRSTKPSIDLDKRAQSVADAFVRQCQVMQSAWAEIGSSPRPLSQIVSASVTEVERPHAPVDLIVTSPPYATSYDYMDLHQLSALWLGFANDHRDLRHGVIGASARRFGLASALKDLNSVGEQIVFSLFDRDRAAAEAVATYFLDIQKVTKRCHEFLRSGGISVFVIGNTQLSGIRIDSANHLVESLLDSGFAQVRVAKRQLSNKPNTPYRLPNGRLSSTRTDMQIYAEEYIVMAQRK